MKKQSQKNKRPRGQLPVMVVYMLIGAMCGVAMVDFVSSDQPPLFGSKILSLLVLFVLMYVLMFAHIALHELGHMVFGLVSGYSFSSYRIGSLMFLREKGRLRLRLYSLSGTGGQCLMIPPDGNDEDCPVLLYNLGGALFNGLFALLPLSLLALGAGGFARAVLVMNGFIGMVFGLLNGLPIKLGAVDNDGTNALSLSKNPAARRAFAVQLRINDSLSRGIRLKDMPEEWFAPPAEADKGNTLAASMSVFACNRLMDMGDIENSETAIDALLSSDCALIGLHRNLLVCDLIFCKLMLGKEYLSLLTGEQKKFMTAMKNYPSVIRTQYAMALLGEKDRTKADKIKQLFEKRAKTYPYPCEIQSERELMEKAKTAK